VTPVDLVLAEDGEGDVRLALHALKSAGFASRTLVVRDGAEALQVLLDPDRVLPRLVILDLKMPKVDGLEVLQQLRATPRTSTTPVVMLSNSRQTRDIAQAYALGCNGYVVKSMDFEEYSSSMASLVRFWLDVNTLVGSQ
jgi:two-component system response regulator